MSVAPRTSRQKRSPLVAAARSGSARSSRANRRAGRLGVGVAAGDRGLDGGQAGQPALQGPPGDHQGVARGQGEQHLQAPGGRLEGGAGRAQQPLAAAREQLLEGLGVGHVHRLEPVHHLGGVGLGLEGDVVHHPAQLLGQPRHPGEQALAGHLMAGQPEPQLVAGQVGRLARSRPRSRAPAAPWPGRRAGMASSYWPSTERASWPTRVPTWSPATRPPTRPTMSPTPGDPMPAPVPSASATRRAPGSTRGAKPPRTASAQSGRFTGLATRATPGPGRLVTGSTQSSARRRRSSQDRASPGSGAAAGLWQLGHHAQVLGPGRGGHRHLPGQLPVDRPAGGRHQPGELPEQRDPPEEIPCAAQPFGHALNATRGMPGSRSLLSG